MIDLEKYRLKKQEDTKIQELKETIMDNPLAFLLDQIEEVRSDLMPIYTIISTLMKNQLQFSEELIMERERFSFVLINLINLITFLGHQLSEANGVITSDELNIISDEFFDTQNKRKIDNDELSYIFALLVKILKDDIKNIDSTILSQCLNCDIDQIQTLITQWINDNGEK